MAPKLTDFRREEFLITDFGARVCDVPQTEAIQRAIDAAYLNGGGRVKVPEGCFLTGGLRLRSGVMLYLESGARLKGSRDPEDYFGYLSDGLEPIKGYDPEKRGSVYRFSRWNNALIRIIGAKNVAIIGERGSVIDGSNVYDERGEEKYRGPHGINVWDCDGLLLSGYTVTDSSNWAHAIFNSRDITATDLTVLGGHDGFDVRTCDNVLIEDCRFYTGDDCVAGFDNNDVVIRRCVFDTACSALRFGGNNVLIEDCEGYAPSRFGFRGDLSQEKKEAGALTDSTCRHNMMTAFLYYCDFRAEIRRTPGNITLRRCRFTSPDSLFRLDFDGTHVWCCNRSLSSIRFEDCEINGVSSPVYIYGDEKEPLSLTLKNVTLGARDGYGEKSVIQAINYDTIELDGVTLKGFDDPTLLSLSDGRVSLKDTTPIRTVTDGTLEVEANAPIA